MNEFKVRVAANEPGTVFELKPPLVQGALNDEVDPFQMPSILQVNPDALPPLTASEEWKIRIANDRDEPLYVSRAEGGNVSPIVIPAASLASCVGKTARVVYDVRHNGEDLTSGIRTLRIRSLPESSDPRLQGVHVKEAIEGVLDTTSLTGDPSYVIPPWVWIAVGQTFHVAIEGTAASGESVTRIVADWMTLEHTDVAGTMDGCREWLRTLADDSELQIRLWVSFIGATDVDDAYAFNTTSLRLRTAS